MWYFAYGTNLNQPDLDAWCREKGLPPLNLRAKSWRRATLHNFDLRFDCYSKRRDCVAANIRAVNGACVKGVAFELMLEEFNLVARKEGAPQTYVEKDVEVVLEDGSVVAGKTFCCRPGTEHVGQCPSKMYLDLIIRGAADYGLDPIWLEKLRGIRAT